MEQQSSYFKDLVRNYTDFARQPLLIFQLALTIIYIPSMSLWVPTFLNFVQQRKGILLNDYLLNIIPAVDVSIPLSVFCYMPVVLAILISLPYAKNFLIGLQTYALVTTLRMLTIFLVPLEAPAGYVHITDPFMHSMVYAGQVINKDLFFSGHTSTMIVLLLMVPQRWKSLFSFFAVMVATLVLVQHAHYTIDVIAAPFFTLFVYQFVNVAHSIKFVWEEGKVYINEQVYELNLLPKFLRS